MKDQFFQWLPQELRQKALLSISGQKAIKFPAAYFTKYPKSQHLAWQNLVPMQIDGSIVKTGPGHLTDGLIKTLEKYQVEYEIIQL